MTSRCPPADERCADAAAAEADDVEEAPVLTGIPSNCCLHTYHHRRSMTLQPKKVTIIRVTALQTEKQSTTFPDETAGNTSKKCTLIQILSEHHVRKMTYSMNKVRVSYTMIWECEENESRKKLRPYFFHTTVWLPAFCRAATIKFPPTTQISWPFPDFWPFPWSFTDPNQIPWHFHVSRNSRNFSVLYWIILPICLRMVLSGDCCLRLAQYTPGVACQKRRLQSPLRCSQTNRKIAGTEVFSRCRYELTDDAETTLWGSSFQIKVATNGKAWMDANSSVWQFDACIRYGLSSHDRNVFSWWTNTPRN